MSKLVVGRIPTTKAQQKKRWIVQTTVHLLKNLNLQIVTLQRIKFYPR